MQLYLYNSLTRKKEEFKPINPPYITFYSCGPTIYGPAHLGHGRSYVNFDILKRVLTFNNYKVKHVLNITDVHDDMIKRASELDITIFELAARYIPLFLDDLVSLNIIPADTYPRVTENIPQIIEMIEILIKKGFAYSQKDGSVYFAVAKFKDYGKLSRIKINQAKIGTRVSADKYEKEDSADFALWKAAKPNEPSWDSPWGKGRPGWHIECSVMAKRFLGETIDIHAGAMDLKFPHHENEIAQSQSANGKKFVNFWVHSGLLEINRRKMSKSLGNYIEISQIREKNINPLALRYLFLTAHYRAKLNFTWKGLKAAQNALNNLYETIKEYDEPKIYGERSRTIGCAEFERQFKEAINDDLDTPKALAIMWEVIKSYYPSSAKKKTLLEFDKVLGLGLAQIKEEKLIITEKIKQLINQRETLRKAQDWQRADEIRKEIEREGFMIEDTPEGPKIKKK